ncbi:MAG: DUF2271 domain-containing protein [Planctomycetota bacterium]|nr:MAG: DUF2271 domain-containing protein [Planctomycetota bacterium]
MRLFSFRRENVLGTSFRLVVAARSRAAAEGLERAVLEVVERHRRTFSSYDPKSEVGRLNALPWQQRSGLRVSKYLGRVLGWALDWQRESRGAFDVYLGELRKAWREAAATGREPNPEVLARLVGEGPGFRLERRKRGKKREVLLRCLRPGSFDLGGIAKGFIIDRALRAIAKRTPAALLDIGGDLAVHGRPPRPDGLGWPVAVVDPRRPAENDPPLDTLFLTGMAVASSGGYARGVTVAGRRRSHIIDPRTGRPAEGVLGATVVAPTAAEADALATALCVLEPQDGLALIEKRPVAAALIVDAAGRAHRSRAWARFRAPPPPRTGPPWPRGYSVRISFRQINSWETHPEQRGRRRRFKRHGTAVWVEDPAGRRVRLVSLWFDRDELGHVRELDSFWRDGWVLSGDGADYHPLRAVARASRRPGEYTVVWDGLDDAGRPVPQGRYRVRIDVNREHGPPHGREEHTCATVELVCGERPATGTAPDRPELAGVRVEYGPR